MKIAISSNIIFRLLFEDNKEELKKVHKLIEKYINKNEIFVSNIVFLELYFLLEGIYEWKNETICDVFDTILKVKQFTFENESVIRSAIIKCRKGVSFNNALLGQSGNMRKIKTYTLDTTLKNDTAFIVL